MGGWYGYGARGIGSSRWFLDGVSAYFQVRRSDSQFRFARWKNIIIKSLLGKTTAIIGLSNPQPASIVRLSGCDERYRYAPIKVPACVCLSIARKMRTAVSRFESGPEVSEVPVSDASLW